MKYDRFGNLEDHDSSVTHTPLHFWIVGVACLVVGASMFAGYLGTVFQITVLLAHVPSGTMELLGKLPRWALAARTVGIFAAPVAALLLLLRSRHAFSAFLVLLCALIMGTLGEEFVNLPDVMRTPSTIVVKGATWTFIVAAIAYAHWMRLRRVIH